ATLLIILSLVAVGAGVAIGAYAAFTGLPDFLKQRRLTQRLEDVASAPDFGATDAALVRRQSDGPLPAVDRLIAGSRAGSPVAKLIEQSGVKATPSGIVLISVGGALAGFLLTSLFPIPHFLYFVGALVGFGAPWGFLIRRRISRLHTFEEMFPDALDL